MQCMIRSQSGVDACFCMFVFVCFTKKIGYASNVIHGLQCSSANWITVIGL